MTVRLSLDRYLSFLEADSERIAEVCEHSESGDATEVSGDPEAVARFLDRADTT